MTSVPQEPEPVARAVWLSDRVVLLTLRLTDPMPDAGLGRVVVNDSDQAVALDWRWLDSANGQPPGRLVIGTGLVPPGVTLGELRGVRLGSSDTDLPLATETKSPASFVEEGGVSALDAPARARIQAFLAATPSAHGIGLGTALAESLAALRTEVRTSLPSVEDDPPAVGTLDSITAIDAYGFWLTGSIDRSAVGEVALTAVSPEGSRVEILDGAVAFGAVAFGAAAFGAGDEGHGDGSTVGYEAYVELGDPSRHRHGWVMEFRTRDGGAVEHATPEARTTNVEHVWQRVLAQVAGQSGEALVGVRQIAPALTRLRAAQAGTPARAGASRADPTPPAVPAPAPEPESDATPIPTLHVEPAAPPDESHVTAALLTAPVKRNRSPYAGTFAFAVRGWALPDGGEPATIEARDPTGRVHRTLANLPIPRAPVRYREAPGAEHAGFQFVLSSVPFPTEFEVEVAVVAADGERTELGRVSGQRRSLRSAFRPSLQPMLVTTIGRSGSTWLVALLAQHPEIVAMRPFAYEPNLTSYWAEVLRTLSDPASYMMALQPQINHERWWLGDHRPTPLPASKPFPEMPRWLGSVNVDNLAEIYQSEIESFYGQVRQFEGRGSARYFVEKTSPGLTPRIVAELYPEGREILLVRDFRDMALSIIDYNAKRGLELWGRDRTETEAEWLQYLRREIHTLTSGLRERGDRVHVVRYEDLIASPAEVLADTLIHAGLDGNPARARRAVAAVRETEPHRQESHRTASTFEASVGRWRNELSAESKAAYAEAFDDLLAEFGYEPTA